jgi:hypothetical protein
MLSSLSAPKHLACTSRVLWRKAPLTPDYRLLPSGLIEFLHRGRLSLAHAAGFNSRA